MNCIYVGPFQSNTLYKGGISVVVEAVCSEYINVISRSPDCCNDVRLIPLDACQVKRNIKKLGKFTLSNIANAIAVLFSLKKVIRKNKAECVYYNSSAGIPLMKDLFILLLSKCENNKKIIHIHYADADKILPQQKMLRSITLYLLKRIDQVIFLSYKTKKEFIALGLEEAHTAVLYNFHCYNYLHEQIAHKINNRKDKLELIFLGSICQRKGIIDLLHALLNVNAGYKLHICGQLTDSSIEKEFKHLIAILGNDRVVLHGYVEGQMKSDLLLASDILILPSYGEGFPLALLEGIAAGCAIITTPVGAIEEVFSEVNGHLIQVGDTDSLLEGIRKLSDIDVLAKVSYNNYEMSKQFSIEMFIKSMLTNIREICITQSN